MAAWVLHISGTFIAHGQQLTLHSDSRFMVFLCFTAVISALVVFLVGFSTVGWGTRYGNDKGQFVALAMGIFAAMLLGFAFGLVGCVGKRVYRKQRREGERRPLLFTTKKAEDLEGDTFMTSQQSLIAQLDALGGGASIVSVFVFYNLVTIHTDLTHCFNNCTFMFVLVNAPAFALALISTTVGGAVRLVMNLMPKHTREDFARAVMPATRLSAFMYALSLVFFAGCFGIYGYAKLKPHQYSTFVLAGITLLGMGIGARKLHLAYQVGRRADKHSPLRQSDESKDNFKLWWCPVTKTWHKNVSVCIHPATDQRSLPWSCNTSE